MDAQHNHIPPEPDPGAAPKVVARACNFCRAAHISCETARPCQRCVRLGRGEWCCDVPANKRGRPPIHGRRSAQYQEQQRQKRKKQKMQQQPQQPQPQPQLQTPKLEPHDNDQQPDDGIGRAARAPPEPPLRVRPSPAPTPTPVPPAPASSSRRSPPPLPWSSSSSSSFFQATNTKLEAFFSALPATATSATSATTTTTTKRSPSPSPPSSSSSSFSLAPQPTSPRQLPLPAGNGGASGREQLAALVAQLMAEVRTLREANESLHRDNETLRRRLDALESQQAAHAHRVDSLLEFGAARHASLRSDHNNHHDAPRLQGQTTTPFVTCAHGLEGAWSHLLFTPPASTTMPTSLASSRSPLSPRSSFSSSSTESLSPRSSFSLERSVLQSSLVASQQALDEMQRHVPLLRHYYVAPKDFAVQDIRYPVYVLAPTLGGNSACPVIKWVNEAFVSLSGYTMDKLIGMPLSKLFSSQKSQTAQLAASIFNQCPMSVSGTFALHPLLRQRNGCTVRIDEVNQFFYGQHGAVSFSVTCILGWQADSLRPDEQFGQWLPQLLRLT